VCKLRALCTRSRTGRTIHRHRDQGLVEKARSIASSKAAKRDLKRRQHLMERSFADAANCHGLKHARWRGLWKQAIQDLLIATVQNLRKLIKHLSQSDPQAAYRFTQLLAGSPRSFTRSQPPSCQANPSPNIPIPNRNPRTN
jgi:Transposase DDE domain